MRCNKCRKGTLKPQGGLYHYKECGLPNLYLKNVEWYKCLKCKETEVIIPRVSQLHRCIAWRLVTSPPMLSGSNIKYLRKMLRSSQGEFAEALGVTQVTLSRWEHGRKHSKTSDLLVRLAYIGCKDDEYTHKVHEKLWDILRGIGIEAEVSDKRLTIDPSECMPDKEIAATLAVCVAAQHQRASNPV